MGILESFDDNMDFQPPQLQESDTEQKSIFYTPQTFSLLFYFIFPLIYILPQLFQSWKSPY